MASKPAVKKTPSSSPSATPAAPKAPRKPNIAALSTAQKFELLSMVKAASTTLPDATLADQLTAHFGRPVLTNSVTKYRKEFGLASVGKPKVEDLLKQIDALVAQVGGLQEENANLRDAADLANPPPEPAAGLTD